MEEKQEQSNAEKNIIKLYNYLILSVYNFILMGFASKSRSLPRRWARTLASRWTDGNLSPAFPYPLLPVCGLPAASFLAACLTTSACKCLSACHIPSFQITYLISLTSLTWVVIRDPITLRATSAIKLRFFLLNDYTLCYA